jgi:hypothetical protein
VDRVAKTKLEGSFSGNAENKFLSLFKGRSEFKILYGRAAR